MYGRMGGKDCERLAMSAVIGALWASPANEVSMGGKDSVYPAMLEKK